MEHQGADAGLGRVPRPVPAAAGEEEETESGDVRAAPAIDGAERSGLQQGGSGVGSLRTAEDAGALACEGW